MNSYRTTHISNFVAIAWNLCDLQCFKNRKIWQICAIFRFFAFLGNFEFLPWLQIFEMTLETFSIDWILYEDCQNNKVACKDFSLIYVRPVLGIGPQPIWPKLQNAGDYIDGISHVIKESIFDIINQA